MIHTPTLFVIIGSTRPRRIGPSIAEWLVEIGRQTLSAQFELIDLRGWPLPMDDEPAIPAQGEYQHEHTKAWSRKIASADAFAFLSPQYNWGYPAPLKNALDHLYREWQDKPAIIATYGGHGGGKCAEQLRQVLTGLKMKPMATMPALKLSRERIEANSGEIDPAVELASHADELRAAFLELSAALGTSVALREPADRNDTPGAGR